jgi:phosphatidylinositol-3-phosphatase
MENHEYSGIVGSSSAPYTNQTLIPGGKLFTNYDAVVHPSLPNYLAMTSGGPNGKTGTDSITAGEINVENLFHQLSVAGVVWGAFEETMPYACYKGTFAGTSPNDYALKHDPAMMYADIANSSRCTAVVPYSQLDRANLPQFSFVTPNECSDMHSCSVSTGDTWLKNNVPPLLNAGATVIVTFDEGTTNTGGGGHILTVENGPGIPTATTDTSAYNHYGLLAALERHFGLPLLQNAQTAVPLPISGTSQLTTTSAGTSSVTEKSSRPVVAASRRLVGTLVWLVAGLVVGT